MVNKYSGPCHACGKQVEAGKGIVERVRVSGRRSRYILWCEDCYNASDHSGQEDRCCGDRAYEDCCARACEETY
jgi:hypothetical protein